MLKAFLYFLGNWSVGIVPWEQQHKVLYPPPRSLISRKFKDHCDSQNSQFQWFSDSKMIITHENFYPRI